MNEFVSFFLAPYQSYSTLSVFLESFAALMGIISVYYAWKDKLWVFPTGIISTGIYIYLLYSWGLFGDLLINIYYFIMSIYGWYFWSKGSLSENLQPIRKYSTNHLWHTTIIFIFSFFMVMLIYWYKPYFHAENIVEQDILMALRFGWIDWTDAFTTAIFFVGMYLMSKKILQHWYFWIIGDIIAIPMYLYKGYGITSFQYAIFTLLAIVGLRAWRVQYQQEQRAQ